MQITRARRSITRPGRSGSSRGRRKKPAAGRLNGHQPTAQGGPQCPLSPVASPVPPPRCIVAFVALFTALGGTSYAALKITGKNIVNGSLTGVDVKNRSLGRQGDQAEHARRRRRSRSPRSAPSRTPARGDRHTRQRRPTRRSTPTRSAEPPAASLMTKKRALFEANHGTNHNFANNAIARHARRPRAGHVRRDGASSATRTTARTEHETCTLHVPGGNDTMTFTTAREPRRSRSRRPSTSDVGLLAHRHLHERRQRRHHRRPATSSPSASTDQVWRAGQGCPARPMGQAGLEPASLGL